MITDSYTDEPGVLSPFDLYGPQKKIADICLVTLSYDLMNQLIANYHPEIVAKMNSTSASYPIYRLQIGSKTICLYNSPMGSALAGTCLLEASHLVGAKKFIMAGICGRLDKTILPGEFIVPSEAYRDEGFSYHYAPASDYIGIKNHKIIESFLKEENVPFASGRCWTTDALYKETRTDIKKRREEGCIAVDMECAGCEAIADYYHLSFYEFFFGGDLLDAPKWDKNILGTKDSKKRHLDAFHLVLKLSEKI